MAAVGGDSGANGSDAAPPDAVATSNKSVPKRMFAEVRKWPRTVLGMIVAAIIAVVVAGLWMHFTGPDNTGFQGFILGPSGTAVHQGPTVSSDNVGQLQSGAGVLVVCTSTGDAVVGPKHGGGTQTTRLWDKVRPAGSSDTLGFVPDVLVKTGTTNPVAPHC
jgi:hypothetical protein